jgi:hypothetical protein
MDDPTGILTDMEDAIHPMDDFELLVGFDYPRAPVSGIMMPFTGRDGEGAL